MYRKATTIFAIFAIANCFASSESAIGNNVTGIRCTDRRRDGGQRSIRQPDADEAATPKRKWISELFSEAADVFDVAPGVRVRCKSDYDRYKIHLQNQSVWAVRMLESSEWPRVGLFAGMNHHFGNYDECLQITGSGVRGQYCLAEGVYDYEHGGTIARKSDWSTSPEPESSVWSAIRTFDEDPLRVTRRHLHWAICLPSSCTADDLEKSLNWILGPIFQRNNIRIKARVDPLRCTVQMMAEPPSFLLYLVCVAWVAIIVTVTGATIIDVRKNEPAKTIDKNKAFDRLVKCFSVVENYKKLKHYSPDKVYPGIHLLKIIAIIIVIFEHRGFLYMGFATHHTEEIETKFNGSIMLMTILCVGAIDVFLMIGGFQAYYYKIEPMTKKGLKYTFHFILFRWIRLIPINVPVLLLFVFAVSYVGDGPLWKFRFEKERENCLANGWLLMLGVNNVVNVKGICFPWSWYVGADFQCSIIAAILLSIAAKNKKLGIWATASVFGVSVLVTFFKIYEDKVYGIPRPFIRYLYQYRNKEVYSTLYVSTHGAAGPYLIGFSSAMIAKSLKAKNYRFSPRRTKLLLLLSFLVGFGFHLYAILFFITGRPYNPLENGVYGALHRPFFVLPFACLLCVYFTSGLGGLNKLFDRKEYVPFGNLVWCVYLIHVAPMTFQTFSSRTNLSIASGFGKIFWLVLPDITLGFTLALPLYMLLEAPINSLSKWLQESLNSKSESSACVNTVPSDDVLELKKFE